METRNISEWNVKKEAIKGRLLCLKFWAGREAYFVDLGEEEIQW